MSLNVRTVIGPRIDPCRTPVLMTISAAPCRLQSGAKIMRLFAFLAIFKYVGLPPPPMINVGKSGLNFVFSVINTTLNWGVTGAFKRLSQ